MRLSVRDVVAATGGELLSGGLDRTFEGVGTDSRSLIPGQLFFALVGERFDGHDYVRKAMAQGAAGTVVADMAALETGGRQSGGEAFPPDVALIRVPDTLTALGDLAAWWRRHIGLRVVGITGSCGKTTTKELTAAVLAQRWPVAKNQGNLNNLIGLPLSILAARPLDRWGVLEMGMNQPGEIARLSRIAAPEVGLITTVQPAHLAGVGGLEGVVREKVALWQALPGHGIAVINLDDPYLVEAACNLRCRKVGYTMDPSWQPAADAPDPQVRCLSWEATRTGTRLLFKVGAEELDVAMSLIGRANVANAVAAAAVGNVAGVSGMEIRLGIEGVRPLGARLALKDLGGGRRLIDDSYNANPASMAAALETLKIWGRDGGRVAVLGDMLELGQGEGAFHYRLGEAAGAMRLDLLLAVGGLANRVAEGARQGGLADGRVRTFPSTADLVAWIKAGGLSGLACPFTILVKGSRRMRLEQAVSALEEVFSQGRAEGRRA